MTRIHTVVTKRQPFDVAFELRRRDAPVNVGKLPPRALG